MTSLGFWGRVCHLRAPLVLCWHRYVLISWRMAKHTFVTKSGYTAGFTLFDAACDSSEAQLGPGWSGSEMRLLFGSGADVH